MVRKNSPPGSAGSAHPSGWMTSEGFLQYLDHFINHVNCSPSNQVLLLMNNHDSHVSIGSLNKAKENGVIILTFPPHTSHKLQPLDLSVFGPLKKFYNNACSGYMLNNPGKPITIYEIGELVGKAFPLAFKSNNVTAGFRTAGIYPFNRDIFTDNDFLSSYVTDINIPVAEGSSKDETLSQEDAIQTNSKENISSTPKIDVNSPIALDLQSTSSSAGTVVTPEQIRPFPKAAHKKNSRCGRKKGSTRILTDTPVKQEIELELLKKNVKKRKINFNKNYVGKRKILKQTRVTNKTDLDDNCCICKALYESSTDLKQKEDWFQCRWCGKWAHESCGNVGNKYFECVNCWEVD